MGQEASSTKHIGFHGLDREIGNGGGEGGGTSTPAVSGGRNTGNTGREYHGANATSNRSPKGLRGKSALPRPGGPGVPLPPRRP